MDMDWQGEIVKAVIVRQRLAEVDALPLFSYDLPHVAADEDHLTRAEAALGFLLDCGYRDFLGKADGWPNFYQDVSLFGTADLLGSDLYRHAAEMLDVVDEAGVFADLGLARADVFPIAAGWEQSDLFIMVAPGHASSGRVHWLAGYPVEQYPDFFEFFATVVDLSRDQIARFEAGGF